MADERLAFSLEEKLKMDEQGELKREIDAQLNAQIAKIDKVLSAGVSPQEYTKLNQVKTGLQSACMVLEKVWQQFHKTNA